jgi:acyl-CoA reductase-like NAD-dependent aldehyde dehydrogenase
MTETVPAANSAEIDAALQRSARYASAPLPDIQRCRALRAAADEVLLRIDPIARLLVDEIGKPISLARGEVERSAEVIAWSAAEWETMHTEVIPTRSAAGGDGHLVFTQREPLGIVCAITPFNFPVGLTVHKLAPALAAGNACIIKPSEYAPRTVQAVADAFRAAGFPEGAVEIVPGGPETVEALLADPRPGLYSFTGSARVGQKVKASSGLRPVVLELGSNAATIIHSDADLVRAAAALARGAYAFAGQACFSVQRIIVQSDVHDELVERLLEETTALAVGDPNDPATIVGPMIDEAAAVRVELLLRDAVERGSRLLTGGRRTGAILEPTLVADVEQDAPLWRDEVFGPVAVIARYNAIDDAFALANDSSYGLQTGIFTGNVRVALTALNALHAGAVLVNETSSWRCTPMPFGGVRDSGFGREGPRSAIESMTHIKTAVLAA